MGFVRSPEEVARIARAVTDVRFNGGEYLGVDFESDPNFIRSVLPPGLEPLGNNMMNPMVCRFQGGSCGAFAGGAVYVAARHGHITGKYTLAMYMNTDDAMLFGRDIFGEPKKLALVEFDVSGRNARGTVERGGARLIEIDAQLDRESSLEPAMAIDFNYKASLAADGAGLAGDAELTVSELHLSPTINRTGTGKLKLGGTVHDPLHEIPVGKVLSAQFLFSNFQAKSRVAASIPAADFLPYAYGRYPDWSVFLDQWQDGTTAPEEGGIASQLIVATNAR